MQEEELLILRAQKGDEAAFEALAMQQQKRLYNAALRTMRNAEDAGDMAQEAIIKIYRNLSSFKGDCSFGAWAYRITINTCLDELRRRKKRALVSLDAAQEQGGLQLEDNGGTPEELAERRELAEQIERAISALEPDYRVAVTLRDLEGLSYQEIADATGASLGTVKSRISRARMQLQKKLRVYQSSN